jgi:hypothetical protein
MVDTGTDDIRGDRLYICGPSETRPGCLGQFARAFGWEGPERLVELAQTIDVLQEELAANWGKSVNVKVPLAAIAGIKES